MEWKYLWTSSREADRRVLWKPENRHKFLSEQNQSLLSKHSFVNANVCIEHKCP
jgi:hypothetical protein